VLAVKKWATIWASVTLFVSFPLGAQDQSTQMPPEIAAVVKSLQPTQGRVSLPAANATLDLGDKYDFYGSEDAKKILVQLWGNPSEGVEGVLGLVMPAGASPLSDSWGAVVTYQEAGFVSDDDAADVDYDELLGQMREQETSENEQRKEAGYPEVHLAGWAKRPSYDPASHSVVWARDIVFANEPKHSLNYDVRSLGRKGVLSINLVSTMDKLPQVQHAAATFAKHAAFDTGSRYEDFDASIDKEAEYGIAGLVAAGAGVAAAKKLGLLAILLKFIKPIAIAGIAAFALLRKRIAALFGRKEDHSADWDWDSPAEPDAQEPEAADRPQTNQNEPGG